MDFLEKLDMLMAERHINKSILSKESDIPYTTIAGFYTKGYDKVKLSTLKKLSQYFGVTLDELVADDKPMKLDEHQEKVNALLRLLEQVPDDKLEMLLEMIKPLAES